MLIFWYKNVKITQRRGIRPRIPVCLRRLRPQTPALFLLLTIASLLSSSLALKCI